MNPDPLSAVPAPPPDLRSPDLYPVAFDRTSGRTRLVSLNEAGYRAESFLDERILERTGPGVWLPWAQLQAAAAGVGGESDFIFHIGHVGSTLLSRLLGAHPSLFSLREPAVLRTLAQAELEGEAAQELQARLSLFLALWGRVFRPGQRTLLKATSFAAELGPQMMRLNPSARAILMFVAPSVYLAGILAGPASRDEARINGPMRLQRLHRRIGRSAWRLEGMGEGELAALGWLCEIMALAQIAEAFPQRILWLEFEGFLARPDAGLAACLQRLQGQVPPQDVQRLASSPDLKRYSKDPQHAYDADLRRRVLAQAAQAHGAQIARGLDWLNAAGRAWPALAQGMRLAGAAARGR